MKRQTMLSGQFDAALIVCLSPLGLAQVAVNIPGNRKGVALTERPANYVIHLQSLLDVLERLPRFSLAAQDRSDVSEILGVAVRIVMLPIDGQGCLIA